MFAWDLFTYTDNPVAPPVVESPSGISSNSRRRYKNRGIGHRYKYYSIGFFICVALSQSGIY